VERRRVARPWARRVARRGARRGSQRSCGARALALRERVAPAHRGGVGDGAHDVIWWSVAASLAVAGVGGILGLLGGAGATAVAVPSTASAAVAASFDPDLLADVASYRVPRRRVQLALLLLSIVTPPVTAALLLNRGAARSSRLALLAAGTGALLVIVTAVVQLPLVVWARIVQDGRYGFRTRSVAGWALDHLGMVLARAVLVAAIAALVILIVQRSPVSWPARVTVLSAAVGLTGVLLHPLVVHPLLLPTGPIPSGAHGAAVDELVARSGLDVPVLVGEASIRTTRRNAVATGLGPTRRVVLHDTMFELGPDEVVAITAHELAHVERSDPLRAALAPLPAVLVAGLVLRRSTGRRGDGADGGPSSVGAGGPDGRLDARQVVVMVASLLALVAAATPLVAAGSRLAERAADVRAVELTGDVATYETMLRAFVTDGLADPDPPRWSVLLWGTHPPVGERIAVVRAVDAGAGGGVHEPEDAAAVPLSHVSSFGLLTARR
jgi:STE24 endopeptidase